MPFPSKVSAESILETAVELVEAEGVNGLSMRELAARLGLTVSSLYRYYSDRGALEAAVAAYTASLLNAELEHLENNQDRMARMLHVYRDFAHRRPVLYALLLARRYDGPEVNRALKQLWNTFLNLVSRVTKREDDTSAAVAVWSFVHGFIALEQSGQFGKSGPRGGFERGVDALLKGLSEGQLSSKSTWRGRGETAIKDGQPKKRRMRST